MRAIRKEKPSESSESLLKQAIFASGWIDSDCESDLETSRGPRKEIPPTEPPDLSEPMDLENDSQSRIPPDPESQAATDMEHVAPSEAAEAVEPEPEVSLPAITPHVEREGHWKICSLVLPTLFSVIRDPNYSSKNPREQVREALFRTVPSFRTFVVYSLHLQFSDSMLSCKELYASCCLHQGYSLRSKYALYLPYYLHRYIVLNFSGPVEYVFFEPKYLYNVQ